MAGESAAQSAADGATAEQAGLPAWVATALQVAALLAAFATLLFALLWWRSRRRRPQVNP
jgi:membrane protein implicated in regulation of membrane protease activity